MNHATPATLRRRAGFTLVEGVMSIVVIGVIAALTLPVVNGATDNYIAASAIRRDVERVSYAMERSIRFLREVPAGATDNTVGITSATATEVLMSNGTSLSLKGDDLMLLTDAGAGEGVLLSNVESFEIGYLGEDGTTNVIAILASTQRFAVTIRASGVELRCTAMARARMVPQ